MSVHITWCQKWDPNPHPHTFTACDLRDGYWHVKLDEPPRKLTTFGTPFGRYRWLRLPFGISAAPELFQLKLDEAIEGLENVARIVDDLVVWGNGESPAESIVSHDRSLEGLLERAAEVGLKLKPAKLKH